MPAEQGPIEAEDRRRIHAEEMIRLQAAAEFAAQRALRRSRWQVLQGFFNSAFGLWFLSSVVLAGGVWAWQERTSAVALASERSEAVQQLDFEIAWRARFLWHHGTRVLTPGDERFDAPDSHLNLQVVLHATNSSDAVFYPWYSGHTLHDLIVQLTTLVSDDEAIELFGAVVALNEVDNLARTTRAQSENEALALRREFQRALEGGFTRWKYALAPKP